MDRLGATSYGNDGDERAWVLGRREAGKHGSGDHGVFDVAVTAGGSRARPASIRVVIPAGVEHNVINTSATEPMRLYTVYSPPEHPDGSINRTKQDATDNDRGRHA